jgi:hypothetical protein
MQNTVPHNFRRKSHGIMLRVLAGCFLASALTACAQRSDLVAHDLRVTVVYASHDRINEEATKRGQKHEVYGFYDPLRNEIWCPQGETKTDNLVCGHELRHAVYGAFHAGDGPSFPGASFPGQPMAFGTNRLR